MQGRTMKISSRAIHRAYAKPTGRQIDSYVTCLVASAFTVEAMDAVKNTVLYDQQVRNHGNRFMQALEMMLRKDPEIWADAANEVPLLIDHIRQIATAMAAMLPEHLAVVGAFIEKYKEDPAGCEAFLNVAITDDLTLVTAG